MKCYVIGDVHGCLPELASLVESLPMERGDTVVFLGDYIDRGPDSKGVIDYLVALRRRGEQTTVFLRGNHEDMMLSFMGLSGHHGDAFLLNGGLATLASYGVAAPGGSPTRRGRSAPGGRAATGPRGVLHEAGTVVLRRRLPVRPRRHHPGRSWDHQIGEELIWIRHEFIANPHPLPQTILFGHTPMKEVFFNLPYKIGLDTGLVYGNALSCLEVTGRMLYQIRNGRSEVSVTDVARHWEGRLD